MKKSTLFSNYSNFTKRLFGMSLLVSVLFFAGCYEWGSIIQPEATNTNTTFAVTLTAVDDGNPDNDWTNVDLVNWGVFGALIPEGWSIEDNIPFTINCTEEGYDNSGVLLYDADHSQTLQDSIPAPEGYFWWGAKTAEEASMVYFENYVFTINITTDDQVGEFFLRYASGDLDSDQRNPVETISEPMPITVTSGEAVNDLSAAIGVAMYPNPAVDVLNVNFNDFNNQEVEMRIYDVTGKTVRTENLNSSSNSINISDLKSGMYFVNLKAEAGETTSSIVVK